MSFYDPRVTSTYFYEKNKRTRVIFSSINYVILVYITVHIVMKSMEKFIKFLIGFDVSLMSFYNSRVTFAFLYEKIKKLEKHSPHLITLCLQIPLFELL